MKRILTSDDVLALVRRGETELVMGKNNLCNIPIE